MICSHHGFQVYKLLVFLDKNHEKLTSGSIGPVALDIFMKQTSMHPIKEEYNPFSHYDSEPSADSIMGGLTKKYL